MALTHQTAARDAMVDALTALVDVGGAGTIQISTTEDDYVGAELLAQIPFGGTAFGASSGGVATVNGLPLNDPSADGTGTALFMRVIDGGTTEIFKGTVTATSGGGDLELTSTSITATEQVNLTAGTYTGPV